MAVHEPHAVGISDAPLENSPTNISSVRRCIESHSYDIPKLEGQMLGLEKLEVVVRGDSPETKTHWRATIGCAIHAHPADTKEEALRDLLERCEAVLDTIRTKVQDLVSTAG